MREKADSVYFIRNHFLGIQWYSIFIHFPRTSVNHVYSHVMIYESETDTIKLFGGNQAGSQRVHKTVPGKDLNAKTSVNSNPQNDVL